MKARIVKIVKNGVLVNLYHYPHRLNNGNWSGTTAPTKFLRSLTRRALKHDSELNKTPLSIFDGKNLYVAYVIKYSKADDV